MEDKRLQVALSLLDEKTAKWHRVTKFGDDLLRKFAELMKVHLGYPILSWTRPIKARGRICEKVTRILGNDANCTPEDVANQITDIAGGRVLVIGLDDLATAEKHFQEFIKNTYQFKTWDFERFVESFRPGGFRGVLGGMNMNVEQLGDYPFEVQIMTPLQDTWDKLQHPVYARVRTQGAIEVPPDVVAWFEQLSNEFYQLDLKISLKQRQFRSNGLL